MSNKTGNTIGDVKKRQLSVGRGFEYNELFSLSRLPVEQIAQKNCENLIGSIVIPVGIAGPLSLELENTHFDAVIPLATTEGALVASVNRGCKAISQSGGAKVMVEKRGVTRAPVFACRDGESARKLCRWIEENQKQTANTAEATSSHLKFMGSKSWIRGRNVFVRFEFDTDEAMGMNMVTIATQKLADTIVSATGAKLTSLSSNVCTDKKESGVNQLLGRGYWAQAECVLTAEVLKEVLKVDVSSIFQTHVAKNLVGSNVARSFSQNGHVANVLAAIYLATGQDPAHVVDGAQAYLTIEPEGDRVYCALTIPSVMVGVIGGGTYLPAQTQARNLIKAGKTITALELAGVVAGAALAGEISLLAALATNSLAKAHKTLGRNKS